MRTMKILLALVAFIVIANVLRLANSYLLWWNENTVEVTTDSTLTSDSAKIEFGISVNTISRTNDLALFENRDRYTVLFDGEEEHNVANDYGENDFLVTYADRYYLSFRQFKTNWRNQHDYVFHFFRRNDSLYVHVAIAGKNAMDFERPMLKIAEAGNYRCNVPVDSAGYIYNMIELK